MLRRAPGRAEWRQTWLQLTPTGEEFLPAPLAARRDEDHAGGRAPHPDDRQTLERLFNQIAGHLKHPAHAHENATT